MHIDPHWGLNDHFYFGVTIPLSELKTHAPGPCHVHEIVSCQGNEKRKKAMNRLGISNKNTCYTGSVLAKQLIILHTHLTT